MKKFFKFIIVDFLILVLTSIITLSFLGQMPGVSALFGTNKPRDLGIIYSEKDLQSTQTKLGQVFVEPQENSFEQIASSEDHQVETVLTSTEFSAYMEKFLPLENLQIKFTNSDFEISGKLDRERIPQFAKTWGMSLGENNSKLEEINKYIKQDPVFYISGNASVQKNELNILVTKAELGRIPLPTRNVEVYAEMYSRILFNQIPGFKIDSATVENSQLHYKGTTVKEIPKY